MRLSTSLLAVFAVAPAAWAVDAFRCTLSTSSTGSYTVTASAPFTGTMVGDATATPPTRTKTGTIRIFPPGVNCGTFGATQNDPLSISGSISANGNGSNIHPTGSFLIAIDPGLGTASVQDLSLNLLGTSTASVAAGLSNFTYPTFCTVDPSCSLPFLVPISLTLGNLDVTTLTGVQGTGPASGTLTANPSGGFDFSIPVVLNVTTAASFNGAPFPVDPQPLPVVFAGTIVPAANGQTATVTSSLNLSIDPPSPTTPTVVPPTPFTTPAGSALCAGLNLILNLTVSSTTVHVGSTIGLTAPGTRVLCPCDWNRAGGVTVQDIFDFLASFFSGSGDFNGFDGTTVQDIFDFLACYFGRPIPC